MADSLTTAATPTTDGMVAIAGLRIPGPLAVRIIAALKATYPSVVDGRDDEGAVRAVLIYWITATLADFESRMAEGTALDVELEAVRTAHTQRVDAARAAAVAAARLIQEAPSGPADPTTTS